MGLIKRFTISKEPDMKRTVKKIVQVQPPCTAEMLSLMDCFRRYTAGQADNACNQQRQALAQCARAARKSKADVSVIKSNFYTQLERLAKAWRRSGY